MLSSCEDPACISDCEARHESVMARSIFFCHVYECVHRLSKVVDMMLSHESEHDFGAFP